MTLSRIRRDFCALDRSGGQAESFLERFPRAEVEVLHLPLLQLQLQLYLVNDVKQLETLGAHVLEQQLKGSWTKTTIDFLGCDIFMSQLFFLSRVLSVKSITGTF